MELFYIRVICCTGRYPLKIYRVQIHPTLLSLPVNQFGFPNLLWILKLSKVSHTNLDLGLLENVSLLCSNYNKKLLFQSYFIIYLSNFYTIFYKVLMLLFIVGMCFKFEESVIQKRKLMCCGGRRTWGPTHEQGLSVIRDRGRCLGGTFPRSRQCSVLSSQDEWVRKLFEVFRVLHRSPT